MKNFFFSLPFSRSSYKSTSTIQAQLPLIYVLIFQKLTYFFYEIMQSAHLSPLYVKVVEITQKTPDFPVSCPMVYPPDYSTLLWHLFQRNNPK